MPKPKGQNATSWVRDPEVAQRRAKCVQYRNEGRRYDDFYQELGYKSVQAASKDFTRALEESIAEERVSVEVYRQHELQRLDAELARLTRLYERVEKLLDRQNVTIQFGKVVYLDGQPVPDDTPFLAAVDRLMRIDEQRRRNSDARRKLLGLDAPQRMSMEVLTIDAIDAQIANLTEQLAAAGTEAGAAAGTAQAED